ncbi:MAG: NAD(+) synthase [Bacteroidales bacterium]|nr:NAD(+) synthase [Bacteroidales bacterium]
MTNGFLRIAAAAPRVTVADVENNVNNIIEMANRLDAEGVDIAVMPELAVTAYTCADLFHNSTLLRGAEKGIERLQEWSIIHDMHLIVGTPLVKDGAVYNCAAILRDGQVDYVAKTYIPNYNEFYERRWFAPLPADPAVADRLGIGQRCFACKGAMIGVEICEDLWTPIPPSSRLSMEGAEVIFNLSASDDLIGKYQYLLSLIRQQSARCLAAYAYAGAGRGESTTDLVFAGKAIIAENGTLLAANDRWNPDDNYVIQDVDIEALRRDRLHATTFTDCARRSNLLPATDSHPERLVVIGKKDVELDYRLRRTVNPHPFVPSSADHLDERCTEIVNIQTVGLARRLEAIHCKTLTVGISGGLDSTLALLVAARTFDRLGLDRRGIIGVTMPGFGTTGRTYQNALSLMRHLGVNIREIPIADAVNQHFKDIGHDPAIHDVTYENSQARERTQILMDIANQTGGIVLGTGDLSELALGWATYNGDHMSMYGVNAGVPKTLVSYLVRWFMTRATNDDERHTLADILDTPISPELTPADEHGNIAQKTEDLVGPYELHDFFLYYTLRYGFTPRRIYYLALQAFKDAWEPQTILKWLRIFIRRFFQQQFKRSCLPDGPKVGSVCLSPRGDWRMPSDASAALWLKDLEDL